MPMKNTSKEIISPIYFLCRVDLETGAENLLCGMENVALCGVRQHRLFSIKSIHHDPKYFEILETDLESMQEILHRINLDSQPVISSRFGFAAKILESQSDYPCIDENGKHMYCRISADNYNNRAYIADIDLEEDRITELISLDAGHEWYFRNINWGVGSNDFVMSDGYVENSNSTVKCIYYNMITKQKQELVKLEELVRRLQNRYLPDVSCLCCGEGKVYWLINKRWSKPEGGILITEYDIATGESIERVCIEKYDFQSDFELISNSEKKIQEIFVSNHYLFMNDFKRFKSWRFSLDDWKPERLVKDGSEYKYIAVEINS